MYISNSCVLCLQSIAGNGTFISLDTLPLLFYALFVHLNLNEVQIQICFLSSTLWQLWNISYISKETILAICDGEVIIQLFGMLQKVSLILNGPPQRSQVCNFSIMTAAKNVWPLSLATGFVLLIHIFHIIPQVVRSLNITESHWASFSNAVEKNLKGISSELHFRWI